MRSRIESINLRIGGLRAGKGSLTKGGSAIRENVMRSVPQPLPVILVIAVVIGGFTIGGTAMLGTGQSSTDRTYVLVQDDRCIPVTPLSGETPVAEFYNHSRSSSIGTIDLQRPNTSILFLYRGPTGTSLVLVHGMVERNSQGGSISMSISGLPASGEWVIEDDNYTGPSNYDTWNHTQETSRIDWTWRAAKTDGGVFHGLEDLNGSIRITPRFNQDAALYGEHYDGNVTDWEVLSGDQSDPTRVALKMDSAVTIRTGECPPAGDETPSDDRPDASGDGGGESDDDRAANEEDENYRVCHKPPGNPDNAHTITVGSESAVEAHLDHGDTRGPCPGDS